jgi:hypothetical protein
VLKPACLLARGLRQHAKPALSGAGCWSAAALRPPATALVQHSASSNIGILTRALSSLRVCDGANTQLRGTQGGKSDTAGMRFGPCGMRK